MLNFRRSYYYNGYINCNIHVHKIEFLMFADKNTRVDVDKILFPSHLNFGHISLLHELFCYIRKFISLTRRPVNRSIVFINILRSVTGQCIALHVRTFRSLTCQPMNRSVTFVSSFRSVASQ